MVTIELRNGYFIKVDSLNSTLMQRYIGQTKEGNDKECEKIIGYFSKPVNALERFIKLNRVDVMEGMELSLDEYVDALNKADKDVIAFLENFRGRRL